MALGFHTRLISMESVQILDWEDDWTTRGIKESIYIRMLHLDLNAVRGRHHLCGIWDNFLEGSCDLRSQDGCMNICIDHR